MDWIINNNFREVAGVALSILTLAFFIYQGYLIIEQTQGMQLLKGAAAIIFFYLMATLLQFDFLLWTMSKILPGIIIGIAIIFQPELRRFFTHIGQGRFLSFKRRGGEFSIDSVVNACEVLSSMRRGALIVFSRKTGLKELVDVGTTLNAETTASLIISIFGYDCPLHDGAVILRGGKILSAGCFLPLSNQPDIRRSFGSRHRAALGLAETSDAVVLIVSEETGTLSIAIDSIIHYNVGVAEAKKQLIKILELNETILQKESKT